MMMNSSDSSSPTCYFEMPSTEDFYHNLPGFESLSEIANEKHYYPAPRDWIAVLTDIKGSTKAIEQGRYKDVNIVGASCIISCSNACPGVDLPAIFGGDGASILIPPKYRNAVASALLYTRDMAQSRFDLDLRIAFIPLVDVYSAGLQIKVGKHILSPSNFAASFLGGGLSYAEKLMKEKESQYCLSSEEHAPKGSHEGLSCRWSPMPAQKSEMLTLLVAHQPSAKVTYQEIIQTLLKISPQFAPVTTRNASYKWPPKDLHRELLMLNPSWKLPYLYPYYLVWTGVVAAMVKLQRNDPGTPAGRYVVQMTQNTDYIKFDDTLRLVMDVSQSEKEEILKFLSRLHQEREIYYGTHSSLTALMTCYMASTTKHIHYVDGGDGGYALAAKMLKSQIAAKA